jgi:hypothetical protein
MGGDARDDKERGGGLGEFVLAHDLERQGPTTAIARQLGLDRKPCGDTSGGGSSRQPTLPAGARHGLPQLSGKRLLREIREFGYTGGCTAGPDFLRDVRPPRRAQFNGDSTQRPGARRQAQVEFAEFKAGSSTTNKGWIQGRHDEARIPRMAR